MRSLTLLRILTSLSEHSRRAWPPARRPPRARGAVRGPVPGTGRAPPVGADSLRQHREPNPRPASAATWGGCRVPSPGTLPSSSTSTIARDGRGGQRRKSPHGPAVCPLPPGFRDSRHRLVHVGAPAGRYAPRQIRAGASWPAAVSAATKPAWRCSRRWTTTPRTCGLRPERFHLLGVTAEPGGAVQPGTVVEGLPGRRAAGPLAGSPFQSNRTRWPPERGEHDAEGVGCHVVATLDRVRAVHQHLGL